jgi:hypothetical protein
MKKKVTNTKKAREGDILTLCNPGQFWSPVSKEEAIKEIERSGKPYSVNSPYFTEVAGIRSSIVVMDDRLRGKYLRTDPDKTSKNNLEALPDC